jgi:hypothetical protein
LTHRVHSVCNKCAIRLIMLKQNGIYIKFGFGDHKKIDGCQNNRGWFNLAKMIDHNILIHFNKRCGMAPFSHIHTKCDKCAHAKLSELLPAPKPVEAGSSILYHDPIETAIILYKMDNKKLSTLDNKYERWKITAFNKRCVIHELDGCDDECLCTYNYELPINKETVMNENPLFLETDFIKCKDLFDAYATHGWTSLTELKDPGGELANYKNYGTFWVFSESYNSRGTDTLPYCFVPMTADGIPITQKIWRKHIRKICGNILFPVLLDIVADYLKWFEWEIYYREWKRLLRLSLHDDRFATMKSEFGDYKSLLI